MDASGELKALVTAFTQATTPEDRDALVTQIIYRWTGVQDVDPASRSSRMIYGNDIGDARKLEALEEFKGEPRTAEQIMRRARLDSTKPIDVFKIKARDKGKPEAEGPLAAYRALVVTQKRAGLYAMPCAAAFVLAKA